MVYGSWILGNGPPVKAKFEVAQDKYSLQNFIKNTFIESVKGFINSFMENKFKLWVYEYESNCETYKRI